MLLGGLGIKCSVADARGEGNAVDTPCSRCSSCNVLCNASVQNSSESMVVENPRKISTVPVILEFAPPITPKRTVISTRTKKTAIDSQASRKSARRSTTKAAKRVTLIPVESPLMGSSSGSSNKTTGLRESLVNVGTIEPDSIQSTVSEVTEWNGTESEMNETGKNGMSSSFRNPVNSQNPRKRRRIPGRYTHEEGLIVEILTTTYFALSVVCLIVFALIYFRVILNNYPVDY
ncbi:unnamed protein product [Anisakis simplex]|uniref:Uncharacterized protein n=1 Tax=Anisakis simplex TaxID=6269 RepID=A0A0M3K3S8_ANISI|nr:unnamed protein product [Anisakis simplex]